MAQWCDASVQSLSVLPYGERLKACMRRLSVSSSNCWCHSSRGEGRIWVMKDRMFMERESVIHSILWLLWLKAFAEPEPLSPEGENQIRTERAGVWVWVCPSASLFWCLHKVKANFSGSRRRRLIHPCFWVYFIRPFNLFVHSKDILVYHTFLLP